jgi:hypothetical protein
MFTPHIHHLSKKKKKASYPEVVEARPEILEQNRDDETKIMVAHDITY